jgi:hypothetical protein
MPAIMSDPGVVVPTRAEVHDVLHADFLRDIQKVSGSRPVLQFECSALVRVREPNHFRASR